MAMATQHSTMGPMPPVVGRTAERVLLSEQLAAVRAGHGNVVILGGEAGIGKTTLARDLARQARAAGVVVVPAFCHDLMAASPYGLWLDFSERYRQVADQAELPPLPEVLADRALDRIGTQSAFFAGVTRFLQAIAASRPLMLALEDVQWADPASLELLRYLAARIAHLPLLVLVTYRVDELTRQTPFYQQLPALVRESEGLRMDLKRLDAAELNALVRAHYDLPDADRARLVAHLDAWSDGNPFFAMELLRTLEERDDGGLVRDDDGWRLSEIDQLQVPPLVQQVTDARVAHLGDAIREPLEIASVIGHDVPLDLLIAIAGTDEETLFAAIDRAIEGHLCTESAGGAHIHFVHALTREALYASIPAHRRRALHLTVAESLANQPRPDADATAWHFQQAGDPRAPEWLIRAGDLAQRVYAWETAHARFEAAAALLEGNPEETALQARLQWRCGRLLRYSQPQQAIRHFELAARLAERVNDRVLAADATMAKGLVQCFAGDWRRGLPNQVRGADALLALPPRERYIPSDMTTWLADALPSVALQTEAESAPSLIAIDANRHMSLAWFLATSGQLGGAVEILDRYGHLVPDRAIGPMAIANIGHLEHGRGMLRAAQGDPGDAHAGFMAALLAYRMIDHHACIAFANINALIDLALPYLTTDRDLRAQMIEAAATGIDRARGAFSGDLSPDLAQLPVMFLDGRWREAREIAARNTAYGAYVLQRAMSRAVAPIAHAMGDADAALAIVATFLPDGPDAEPGSAVLLDALAMQRLAADIALDAGDAIRARAWLEANDRWLGWSGSVLGRADNRLAWGRLHHAQGDLARARALAERAIAEATDPGQPPVLIDANRLVGTIARETGDTEKARDALVASMRLADACAAPFERALTLIELARLPGAGTGSLLGEAREILLQLGAAPALARIDADHRPDRQPPTDPSGLTAREIEVLRQVALGLTDAEVAGVLSISPRTVGQHLRSIYGKLDVRSRTEATRFALERRLV